MDKKKISESAKSFVTGLIDKAVLKGKEAINQFFDETLEEITAKGSHIIQGIASGEKINNIIEDSDTSKDLEVNTEYENVDPNEDDEVSIEMDVEEQIEYIPDDDFQKNLTNNLKDFAQDLITANPQMVAAALNSIVTMVADVSKYSEQQKTKRKEIEADRDKVIAEIEGRKEIFLFYLEKTFDERKLQFANFFKIVDDALIKNDNEKLALGLENIQKLASQSPFKELASVETTQKALGDKNHRWDF